MLLRSHWNPRLRRIGIMLAGCCLSVSAGGASNPSSPSVTLEVIVKFARDSDPGRLVQQALKENPTDLRGLADVQEKLHASTGVAMEAQRITSGAELIFRIPEQALLDTVRRTVDGHPDVSATRLMAVQHENPNLPESLLVLEFRESSDAAGLMREAHGDPSHANQLQELATRLCDPSGVPVRGDVGTNAEMIVTVDRPALLRKLVAQLSDLEYVDYAQANTSMQIMK
jgi:hypothetical protein